MSTDNHIDALQNRHAELDRKIDEEEKRPLPDEALIAELKKQKLRVKDEISDLKN